MGRMYSASYAGVAVTAAVDIFEILPAANKPISVHALFIGQSSDAGDAEAELLRYQVIRGHTTSGSGGGTATPRGLLPNTTASGAIVETNNTTAASGGTALTLHSDTFHVASGEKLILTPEMRWACANAELLVVRLGAAPADSLTINATIVFEELI